MANDRTKVESSDALLAAKQRYLKAAEGLATMGAKLVQVVDSEVSKSAANDAGKEAALRLKQHVLKLSGTVKAHSDAVKTSEQNLSSALEQNVQRLSNVTDSLGGSYGRLVQ